jgi:hypothetical protein
VLSIQQLQQLYPPIRDVAGVSFLELASESGTIAVVQLQQAILLRAGSQYYTAAGLQAQRPLCRNAQ